MRMNFTSGPREIPLAIIFVSIAVISPLVACRQGTSAHEFAKTAYAALPIEQPYQFRESMVKDFDRSWRDPGAKSEANEIEIPAQGWSLVYAADAGSVLKLAAEDFRNHLSTSMQAHLVSAERPALGDWAQEKQALVVGRRDQMPGCGQALQAAKDYQIIVS